MGCCWILVLSLITKVQFHVLISPSIQIQLAKCNQRGTIVHLDLQRFCRSSSRNVKVIEKHITRFHYGTALVYLQVEKCVDVIPKKIQSNILQNSHQTWAGTNPIEGTHVAANIDNRTLPMERFYRSTAKYNRFAKHKFHTPNSRYQQRRWLTLLVLCNSGLLLTRFMRIPQYIALYFADITSTHFRRT